MNDRLFDDPSVSAQAPLTPKPPRPGDPDTRPMKDKIFNRGTYPGEHGVPCALQPARGSTRSDETGRRTQAGHFEALGGDEVIWDWAERNSYLLYRWCSRKRLAWRKKRGMRCL